MFRSPNWKFVVADFGLPMYNYGMSTTVCNILENVETPPGVSYLKDEAFFRAHEVELMRDFPGKFVAIRGEEIVGVADTRRELFEQVFQRYNEHLYFMIREVCPESFDTSEPVYLTP